MKYESDEMKKLMKLREALSEAIKSQRRLDNCHLTYIEATNRDGFSRAKTTSYNARAASNAVMLQSDMSTLKNATNSIFSFE